MKNKEHKADKKSKIDIPCSWIERLSTVKVPVLSNLTYGLNVIPIKTQANNFVDLTSGL